MMTTPKDTRETRGSFITSSRKSCVRLSVNRKLSDAGLGGTPRLRRSIFNRIGSFAGKADEMLGQIGLSLDSQGDDLEEALDNFHETLPFFGEMMPMNYDERRINWETFYKYIISPFSNRYKEFVKKEKSRKVLEARRRTITKKKRVRNISLNKEEETELANLLRRICELDSRSQKELLFASPMNASNLMQLRFLSKYKNKLRNFIKHKKEQRDGIISTLPIRIRKAININNKSRIHTETNLQRLTRPHEVNTTYALNIARRRGNSLSMTKPKLFDALDETDFAMNSLQEIKVKTKYPLLFRGKSCCCSSCGGKVYQHIQKMINLFNLPRRENDSPNRKADLKIHIESIPQYVPLHERPPGSPFDAPESPGIMDKFKPLLHEIREKLAVPEDFLESVTPTPNSSDEESVKSESIDSESAEQKEEPIDLTEKRRTTLFFNPENMIFNLNAAKKIDKLRRSNSPLRKMGTLVEKKLEASDILTVLTDKVKQKRRLTQIGGGLYSLYPALKIPSTPKTPIAGDRSPGMRSGSPKISKGLSPSSFGELKLTPIEDSSQTKRRALAVGLQAAPKTIMEEKSGKQTGKERMKDNILKPISLSRFESNSLDTNTFISGGGTGASSSLPNSPMFNINNPMFNTFRSTLGGRSTTTVFPDNRNYLSSFKIRKRVNPFQTKLPNIPIACYTSGNKSKGWKSSFGDGRLKIKSVTTRDTPNIWKQTITLNKREKKIPFTQLLQKKIHKRTMKQVKVPELLLLNKREKEFKTNREFNIHSPRMLSEKFAHSTLVDRESKLLIKKYSKKLPKK